MSKGRILFADNNVAFLDTRKELLEMAGYEVTPASNPEEANAILRDTRVHLAIIDLRLTDDAPDDVSGLTLVKEADPLVPKIVLTAFPTWEAVRDALGPGLDRLPPAVDFVAKKDGPTAMMQAVERAFVNNIRINWDLQIQWDQRVGLSFVHLTSLLQPDLPNDILVQRADELEDLIRKLFYDYQQVRIGRLLWDADKRFCLLVLASSSGGTTDSRILVCGERERLKQERNKLSLTPSTIQGARLADIAETTHFGANLYELPGADIETVQTLRDLFQVGKRRSLKTAFAHLGDVLVTWHRPGQMGQEAGNLMSLYRQWVGLEEDDDSRMEVEQRVEWLVQVARTLGAVEIKRGGSVVTFCFPNQSPMRYPDPVATAYTPLAQYDAPVVCRVSPGRLTAENVLVDAEQNAWLTDFARADQAPQWWDFVCLEAAVRFDLSQAPDLTAWHDFEECLVAPVYLHDRLQDKEVIDDLQTSVALIEQVRRQAGSETGPDPLPYYAGLLVWAVGAMAQYDPEALHTQADRLRGAHLLLAAAVIAERLNKPTDIPPVERDLRLDEEGEVSIGDRCIAVLTGLRLELFRCLYDRAGQIVSSRTIVDTVYRRKYGEECDASDHDQKQRIRQEISRLRKDIEPDPGCPRYIITVTRKGYRLQVSGKPEG